MSIKSFPIHSKLNFISHNPHGASISSITTKPFLFLPFSPTSLRNPLSLPLRTRTRFHTTPHLKALYAFPPDQNSAPPQPNEPDRNLSLAQDAISRFLQEELGIAIDESLSIASNCPKYTRMIVDSVRDLEEWNSWEENGEGYQKFDGDMGFKEKVAHMAKEKGDGGKVAFLESVGLSLSSAIGLARYVSSDPLPVLIHKVKYIKDIFFSGSDDEGLVGKNARRMLMYLSIPIDEDVQQTLSFFEKIEARRGGLNMLGSVEASFRFLVESFPRLLLLSVESHFEPMVQFLESIGVDRGCLGKVVLLFPPIMLCNIKQISKRVLSYEKVSAGNSDVGKMLLKYPWFLSTSIQENYKEILSFFDVEKVPEVDANRAIKKWPHLLGCSTTKLNLMVEQFGDFGIRNKKLGKVIGSSPQLLLRKPQEFLQVVLFLEDLGFDKDTIGEIITRCPEIFATSIEKTLKRKLDFMVRFGVSKYHFTRVIKKYPELLVSDVNRALLPRMKYLMDIGLSTRDIAFMVRKFSPLLGYSIDKVLRPKVDFLVNTMDKPVTDVIDYPRYFSYSLEKKIKPRFWVLKGRNIEFDLKDMLGKNDEDFAADFMGVGATYNPLSGSRRGSLK